MDYLTPEQIERFWSKVDTYGDDPAYCWIWQGYLDIAGYGRIQLGGKPALVHRVSYMIAHNASWQSMEFRRIGHKCQNAGCVNPAHLKLLPYMPKG